jgi:hypothetical protein
MTLMELASILPGYVTLNIHANTKAWTGIPAGVVASGGFHRALVVTATPYAPYAMEVSIELKEEYK